MRSTRVNAALGAAVIAAAGLTAFATVGARADEKTPVVAESFHNETPAPQPSTRPAMKAEIEDEADARCLEGQNGGTIHLEFSPGFLTGPRSPRTPEEAIASADVSHGLVDAESGNYTEDVTYARVGKASEQAKDGESRTYLGRSANGTPRIIHHLAFGGSPDGGWGAQSSTTCSPLE